MFDLEPFRGTEGVVNNYRQCATCHCAGRQRQTRARPCRSTDAGVLGVCVGNLEERKRITPDVGLREESLLLAETRFGEERTGSGTWTWTRAKRWIKHRLFTAFWPVVRSRLFVKLRSLLSHSLVPVSLCGAGAGLGVLAASAVAFPVGYGALSGTAAMAGALGLVKLHARLVPPQQASRFVGVFRSRREAVSPRKTSWECESIL